MFGYGYAIPRIHTLSKGVPVPPAGFIFLIDDDGAYLTDDDGAYLVEAI